MRDVTLLADRVLAEPADGGQRPSLPDHDTPAPIGARPEAAPARLRARVVPPEGAERGA
jgi:hypothetical protein